MRHYASGPRLGVVGTEDSRQLQIVFKDFHDTLDRPWCDDNVRVDKKQNFTSRMSCPAIASRCNAGIFPLADNFNSHSISDNWGGIRGTVVHNNDFGTRTI